MVNEQFKPFDCSPVWRQIAELLKSGVDDLQEVNRIELEPLEGPEVTELGFLDATWKHT